MIRAWRSAGLTFCLVAGAACQVPHEELALVIGSPTASARATRFEGALAAGEPAGTALARWGLPHALQEISGMALTDDGRLLVHDDEIGAVWEVDYRRGVVMKRFSLGSGVVKDDFEGIALAHGSIYLLASGGKLYEFAEGAEGTRVKYTVHQTGLKDKCEFEGVAFDPAINSLLLVCKHVHTKALQGDLVIYRWSLADTTDARISKIIVPLAGIIGANAWTTLNPSDITVDPITGYYVMVASLQRAIFAITPLGAVVFARPLPPGHEQVEGIAITKEGALILSDEARITPAIIAIYRWP